MFRKLSIATLMFVGALAMAPNANAGTATGVVTFSGTVSSACSFTNPTPGTLGYHSGGSNYSFSVNNPGGTTGTVGITCAGSATLSIADGVDGTSNPTAANSIPTQLIVSGLPYGTNIANSPANLGGATSVNVPSTGITGSADSQVYLRATFASAPAPGNYSYTTTITATY